MATNLPVHPVTGDASWARVVRQARCADSGLDPDEWFPVGIDPVTARQEAAAAIAVCAGCLVRVDCLVLSLRHWDVGQHGVWGGLVAADRARLSRRTAVAGMIALPSSPQVPLRLVMDGDVQ
jgi:Transcription factor WhiB